MMLRVAHLPLRGTRVLDVTTSIAGPYCAQILAALGADVVKVERPDTGDDARAWGPPFWDGEGTMFLSANAGKRSLGITLRDPDGREAVLRLAERSDVFLQSLRPGHADALGIGPDVVRARNPRVVYCSIGAYGRVGPLSREPGYDALMQAAGGLISVTGEPGRPGVRVGASLIDQGTGTWAALGVLAALLERDRTGTAAEVDVSLYETALGYLGYHLADRARNLEEAERLVRRALARDRLDRRRAGDAEPDNAAYLDSLAWVLFRRDKLPEARVLLERVSAMPDGAADAVVWDHLGDVCFRLDDKPAAKAAWERAAALYPTDHRGQRDGRLEEVRRKLRRVP